MVNTTKLSKSDNITLSRKDLEKIKSDMFEAGYLAGAQKLDITEKDLVEINLNLTFAGNIIARVGGPKELVDWLYHVSRKCIAIINKEKE
jgi:hypothetical protein